MTYVEGGHICIGFTECRCAKCIAEKRRNVIASDPLCQCQGCGMWASIRRLGEPHACHRNADGTYEEGGTFQ